MLGQLSSSFCILKGPLKFILIFFLTFSISSKAGAQNIKELTNKLPLTLAPGMKNVNAKNHLIIIESKSNKIHLKNIIDFTKSQYRSTKDLKPVEKMKNGSHNYWLILPFSLQGNLSMDIAYFAGGSQLDSLWVLDQHYFATQNHKIPFYNFKLDLTKTIKSGDLKGLGLKLQSSDRYIILNMKNYGYSDYSYPHISDAAFFDQWYFETHLNKFIFFLFITGIELGLIMYLTIQYILLRRKYLLWYIIYVTAQSLPNLDFLLWSFSDTLPIPYSWFHFKMFHLISIVISYTAFIKVMLEKEIKVYNYIFYSLAGICILFFGIDLLLLFLNMDFYSYHIYAILRSSTSIICLASLLYLLITQNPKNVKPLFIGTLILIFFEIIGWFFLYEIRSYVINIGILVEFIFFSYILSMKIKNQEMETVFIKDQNYKLIEQQNEIKQSIARDLHDEVGSIITKLNLQLQLDKEKQENDNEKNTLQKYQLSVQKISLGLKDLINVISEENTQFSELVASIRTLVNEYFEHTDLLIHFHDNNPNIDSENITIGFRMKRTIHAIIKEILQNTLKHSFADTLWVEVIMNTDLTLKVSIADNGVGFDTAATYKGHGLKNIIKRSKELNAHFSIVSNKGNGSKATILIPLKNKDGRIFN